MIFYDFSTFSSDLNDFSATLMRDEAFGLDLWLSA
jgi:hypothetical protein